jgi:hemophore-related protein
MPKFNTRATRGAAVVIGGLAAATIAAPTSQAAPDCTASGVAGTVSTTTAAAQSYLANHPDANQAVTAAMNQPRPVASANLRSYFTGHPQQYNDLRSILAPIGETQRQCNVTALPPDLASAYDEFMAG